MNNGTSFVLHHRASLDIETMLTTDSCFNTKNANARREAVLAWVRENTDYVASRWLDQRVNLRASIQNIVKDLLERLAKYETHRLNGMSVDTANDQVGINTRYVNVYEMNRVAA